MTKSKGKKRKTRKKLRKNVRERGKLPTRKMTQELSEGVKVSIEIEPSIHRGQPHPKFHGRTGTVSGKQGRSYVINLKGENKKVISGPEHIKKVKS
ncbi:50S ribosomal protein L21 [candidate division MSBL1 archaeon SCGC-AAA259O05]|uniref:Large ribosomal subunit protein eL21 n=1 Tax=candidate division MSBL1 archaeon SCGC-AAA259O05 TaxID=1698271 RepID=A0A133V3V7_9EURY|nr:50S ribosomal protein L21 [candidate division MSBL1 archaeon SCGC-AAA259O05]